MKKPSLPVLRTIILFSSVFLVAELSVITLLFAFGHISKTRSGKIFLLIILITELFLYSCTVVWYIRMRKDYRALCRRFTDGEIFQDYFARIGDYDPETAAVSGKLNGMIDRQNMISLSTKQAEFLALQNQINPHFLYNTLESIRGDALMIGADEIADITEALSVFFRYSITNTKNMATLAEELDNVDNYFIIQKYRFEDKLDLEVRYLDDEALLMRTPCPKLSLQPIVENAIFHGIERVRGGGKIIITVMNVDDTVHVNVSDNGKGMEPETLHALNAQLRRAAAGADEESGQKKKGGIALRNVSRRIKLLFGEEYGLLVSSAPGLGTSVEMTLPAYHEDETA